MSVNIKGFVKNDLNEIIFLFIFGAKVIMPISAKNGDYVCATYIVFQSIPDTRRAEGKLTKSPQGPGDIYGDYPPIICIGHNAALYCKVYIQVKGQLQYGIFALQAYRVKARINFVQKSVCVLCILRQIDRYKGHRRNI